MLKTAFTYVFHLLKLLNPIGLVYELIKNRGKVGYRLKMLFNEFPTEPIEALVAVTILSMGLFFLTPLAASESNLAATEFIRGVLPLWAWGLMMLYIGIAQGHALLTDCDSGRRHSSFVALLFWLFIGLGFTLSSLPPATLLYISIIISNFWIYYRVGRPKDKHKLRRVLPHERE